MDSNSQPAGADIWVRGGEMGELIRNADWSNTPLGPIESWPHSLKTAVRIMLSSRQPIWIGWGEDLTYLYNDAYLSIIGGKHPHMLGQPVSVVWPELWNIIEPMLKTAMKGDEGTYVESQLLIMERHGFREETYYTFSYSPIPDDDGRPGGIICANTDDTQRRIGERQMALLKELAARTANAQSWQEACQRSAEALRVNDRDLPFAMIYLADPDSGGFKLAAACGIAPGHPGTPQVLTSEEHGPWPVDELMKTRAIVAVDDLSSISTFSPPTGGWKEPPTKAALLPITASGESGRGGVLVVGLNPFRLFDDGYRNFLELVAGQIAASIASAQAYEEERKRAEALSQIDRAKTAFFSNISHEFRTPLTLMLGPAEELLSGALGDTNEVQRTHLTTLRSNAVRLQKLVNNLLDFARVEAGRFQASYEPVDIGLLTRELASTFSSAFHRAGLLYVIDCPSIQEPVYADRDMWEKIVLNLLSNALKFTLNGAIEISLRSTDTRIILIVSDTGVGIPEAQLPHVFERFHRVQETRARTQEGSGIGLALVQELVKFHGGSIRVESEIDKGTTFTVAIPKGRAHLPQERINEARMLSSTGLGANPFVEEVLRWLPESHDGENMPPPIRAPGPVQLRSASEKVERILIADDNLDMRHYLKRLLETHWHVTVVEDGAKALEVARAEQPDVILSDVMMPGLPGFELLRQLREDERTRAIPVILLSARAGEESYIEGMNAGADDYIVKPFGTRELIARVKALLEVTRVRRESEQRVSNILESITDGFQVIDRDGRLTYMNSEAKRILTEHGVDPERSIGKHFWQEVLPESVNSEAAARQQRVMIERVPVAFETYYAPWRRWYSFRVYPVPEGGIVNYFHDITEGKTSEHLLRDSLQQQKILYRFLEQLATADSLDEIYQAALDAITSAIGCQRASILLLDPNQIMRFAAWSGLSERYRKALEGHSPWKPDTPDPQPVCIPDISVAQFEESEKLTIMAEGIRALAFIPVVLDGRLIGKFMTSYDQCHVFEPAEVELSLSISRQLALGIEQQQSEAALREHQDLLNAELAAAQRLQETSTQLIGAGNAESIYEQILAAAVEIMNADYASLQMLYPGAGAGQQLRLLGHCGFSKEAVDFWRSVNVESESSCGLALRTRERVIVPDVEVCEFMAGSQDLKTYLGTGIHAVQSTPLLSRGGGLVGMISTHWKQPHHPSARDLRLLDVLARQAADLIDRSQADQLLRHSEERFREIADSSPNMIWMTDAEGRISFLNRAGLDYFGIEPDQMSGFDWASTIHPEDRDRYVGAFEKALREGKRFHQRMRVRSKGGDWRWFESRGNPIFDEGGSIAGFVGSSPDITEIYESQERLKELDRRKDEFLANMSHEIRSPLTAIMGYSDILLDRIKDPEEMECLKTIKDSGNYLLEIVNDILDLSKIQAGKLVLNIESVSPHSLLTEVQSLMDVRAKDKNLPISLSYEDVLPDWIQTDRTRLRQILINLVSNAIKFTQAGRVEIVARFLEDANLLQIEVIDTGIGIAPEQQKILFQPFTQLDTSSTRLHGGTGLGLAITWRLVGMLGGRIWVESEQGKGSKFRVEIPTGNLEGVAGRDLPKGGQIRLEDFPLAYARVLVVDDREEIRNLVARYLNEAGGRVETVATGEGAITAIEAAEAAGQSFSAVILDVQMPGMDGYETARKLRAKGLRTPIIALTAAAMVGDREKCLQAGCDDYLTKPIDRAKLLDIVAHHAQIPPRRERKTRILLVDDSDGARVLMKRLLEKQGHEVEGVGDGRSAISIADRFKPDLVFLDIRLPDMNGDELMRRLKASSANGTKFVALSGYRAVDVPGSDEFDHYLEKPLNREDLARVLASL